MGDGAVGSIIGLPMFFEIGLVLLMPVIYLAARAVGSIADHHRKTPALAGLSAMHGLVPPHPPPLTAIDLLGADLGITPDRFDSNDRRVGHEGLPSGGAAGTAVTTQTEQRTRPNFGITIFSVLLPVALMMGKALVDIFIADEDTCCDRPSTCWATRRGHHPHRRRGAATVATITASSLMLGPVDGMSTGELSLVVLAVGSGSLFF